MYQLDCKQKFQRNFKIKYENEKIPENIFKTVLRKMLSILFRLDVLKNGTNLTSVIHSLFYIHVKQASTI